MGASPTPPFTIHLEMLYNVCTIHEKKEVKYLAAELPEPDEGQARAVLLTPPRNSWQ
jgi:hypothetical protein